MAREAKSVPSAHCAMQFVYWQNCIVFIHMLRCMLLYAMHTTQHLIDRYTCMHAPIWQLTFGTIRHASAPIPFRFRFALHLHWIHSLYLFYSSFCLPKCSWRFVCCAVCDTNLNVIYSHSALQINKINVKRNCFTLSRRIPAHSMKKPFPLVI